MNRKNHSDIKICKTCQQEIKSTRRQHYCTDECRKIGKRKLEKQWKTPEKRHLQYKRALEKYPNKNKEASKDYRDRNKDLVNQRERERYQKNIEVEREKNRIFRENNRWHYDRQLAKHDLKKKNIIDLDCVDALVAMRHLKRELKRRNND